MTSTSRGEGGAPFLGQLTIGMSISESPETDLAKRGLSSTHLDHAFVDLTRAFLAYCATLAYGGDHRVSGFTDILFDLLRTYDSGRVEPAERIRNFLAWPIHLSLAARDRASLRDVAVIEELDPPADLVANGLDRQRALPPDSPENRLIWARCLTAMRRRMTDEIDVRILLGGKVTGFLGKYPGLAEEALLAIRAGKPLYLLGGFGGCTEAVIRAVLGEEPEALTLDFQVANTDHYAEMIKLSFAPDEPVDYGTMVESFARVGRTPELSGLKNGLSEADNRRLFATDDVDEMVALVLRGLTRLGTP
jgi:hypothetical protein